MRSRVHTFASNGSGSFRGSRLGNFGPKDAVAGHDPDRADRMLPSLLERIESSGVGRGDGRLDIGIDRDQMLRSVNGLTESSVN